MERITVTVTADTHDIGAQVLKHLDEWLTRVSITATVTIVVEETKLPPFDIDLPKPSNNMQRDVDEFLTQLREDNR